jgi:hypothetical protein
MPNAVVMTGYGPPEVLKWAQVPLPEPGPGQIRIKVRAAGISPTDLVLRAGYLKDTRPGPRAGPGRRRVRRGRAGGAGRRGRPGRRAEAGHHLVRPGRRRLRRHPFRTHPGPGSRRAG